MKKKVILVTIICLFIDQLTKYLVVSKMALNSSIVVIKNFFNITYVRNVGAAFSIFNNKQILLVVIGIFFLLYLTKQLTLEEKISNFEVIVYGFLYAGVLGNVIDRVINNYVIDFLDFYIFGYNYPVFNIADMMIVVGMILLIIVSIRREHNENRSK